VCVCVSVSVCVCECVASDPQAQLWGVVDLPYFFRTDCVAAFFFMQEHTHTHLVTVTA
jgi:hypothetical protein